MILKAQLLQDNGEPLDDLNGGKILIDDCKFVVDGRSKHLGQFLIITQKQPDKATTKDLQTMLLKKGRARDA